MKKKENDMTKNGRIIEELPKSFYTAKKEFEKVFTFQTSKAKNENKKEELKNYAVLFGLIQEYNAFLSKYEEKIAVHLKDLMDEVKDIKVLLADYGKKLEWDNDAQWLYFSEMENKDWREFDKESNKEFLEKKNV